MKSTSSACTRINAQSASHQSHHATNHHHYITHPLPMELHKQHIISKHWNDFRFFFEWFWNKLARYEKLTRKRGFETREKKQQQWRECTQIIVSVLPKLKMDFVDDLFFRFGMVWCCLTHNCATSSGAVHRKALILLDVLQPSWNFGNILLRTKLKNELFCFSKFSS